MPEQYRVNESRLARDPSSPLLFSHGLENPSEPVVGLRSADHGALRAIARCQGAAGQGLALRRTVEPQEEEEGGGDTEGWGWGAWLCAEYLERGDYNVIVQEWAALSASPCYLTAAHNVRFAGRCLAAVVRAAWADGAADVHLLGFSLGAHVPALAAHALRPQKLQRITGLDPAMPLFVTSSPGEKLDASDARFVDVVHTNALAQGKAERCGHLDFYANGGVTQPGCAGDAGCNHHRALAYFTESVRSQAGFWGWPCGGILHYALGLCPPSGAPTRMGEDADRRARGFYIITTNSHSPFAKGPWQAAAAGKGVGASGKTRSPLRTALRLFER